jgi:hypothetical protein
VRASSAAGVVRIARIGDIELEAYPLCLGGNAFGRSLDEQRLGGLSRLPA